MFNDLNDHFVYSRWKNAIMYDYCCILNLNFNKSLKPNNHLYTIFFFFEEFFLSIKDIAE